MPFTVSILTDSGKLDSANAQKDKGGRRAGISLCPDGAGGAGKGQRQEHGGTAQQQTVSVPSPAAFAASLLTPLPKSES